MLTNTSKFFASLKYWTKPPRSSIIIKMVSPNRVHRIHKLSIMRTIKFVLACLYSLACYSATAQGTNTTVEALTHIEIEFRHDETGLEIMLLNFESGKLYEGDTISFTLGGVQNRHQEYSIAGKRNTKLDKNALKIDLYEGTVDEIVDHGISEIRLNGFLYHISRSDQKNLAQAAKAAFRKKAARIKKEQQ